MKIKRIEFAHEITDPYMDNLDVFVENEDGYTYTIVVSTPGDLLDQMEQEKIRFAGNCAHLFQFCFTHIAKILSKQ